MSEQPDLDPKVVATRAILNTGAVGGMLLFLATLMVVVVVVGYRDIARPMAAAHIEFLKAQEKALESQSVSIRQMADSSTQNSATIRQLADATTQQSATLNEMRSIMGKQADNISRLMTLFERKF